MRRLFLDGLLSDTFTIMGDDAKHLLYSMRVKPKQIFTVVDKNKKVAQAEVLSCTSDTVQMKFLHYIDAADTEPPIDVVLAQCLPKGDKMEYIVQKAVELGIKNIVPVVSQHCVVKYDAKKKLQRQQKWQKIADEAAKQCGRTAKPAVEAVTDFKQLTEKYGDYSCIICYEAEDDLSVKEVLQKINSDKYLILIGPEGGLSSEEVAFCKKNNFISISLGKRILRTETASLAMLSILMYEKDAL